MAWIDVGERHQRGPREVRGGALRGPDGIALLGGLEDPGVVGLDEPVVMRELAAAHLEHPVALGVVPELLHAPDQPGTGVREQSRMEPAMRVAVGGDVLPAGGGGGLEVGDPDLGELLAAEQRDCQPHRETVEHHAHGVQVLEVVGLTRTRRLGSDLSSPSVCSRRTASRRGVRLTPSWAESWTCENVAPGSSSPNRIRRRSSSYEAFLEEATKLTPLRRLIPPEDIASAAVFLASDASASITGDDMNLSGGLAMH